VRALEEKKNKVVEKWFVDKLPTYYIMVDKEFENCESIRRSFGKINAK
jgi:peptidyl-prolyl cis-trans isomerase SurA